jgi:hemerythrin superfamily protein
MAAVNGEQRDEDVLTLLSQQHDRARSLLAELHECFAPLSDSGAAAAGAFRELVHLLVAHEAAEETVIYPVLKTQLQAATVVNPRLAEEHEAKRMLARLEKLAEAVFEFPGAWAEFEQAVLAHAEHEEHEVFPLLRERVDPGERRDMAARLRYAEAAAPTHAHRHAPDGTVGNLLLGPVLASIDRVRDATHQRRHPSRHPVQRGGQPEG